MEALYAELQGMDAGLAEQRLWAEALRLLLLMRATIGGAGGPGDQP